VKYKWPLMKQTISVFDRMKMIGFIATTKQFTNGKMVRKFEKEWSRWLGAKYSLFVSSGSTANSLLVEAIKEKYGLSNDKVLVPACTWVTNVGPIIQSGLQPVFCDINTSNFSFLEEDLLAIKEAHPDIKVIFVTHLLGFPANNEVYQKVFPDAIIIDDVCESHGCVAQDGSKMGSQSIGATFSFYFGHHMTTIEGGMVCTNDRELYNIMRMKRSHGMARESEYFDQYAQMYPDIDRSFLFMTDGYNFRNHEIPAVLGIAQLKRLDKMIRRRRENYEQYYGILMENTNKFLPVGRNPGNSSFCFPFIARNVEIKNRFRELLIQYGIEYRPVVSGNLLRHPFLSDYRMALDKESYNVDTVHDLGIYVGNNHFLDYRDIYVLVDIMKMLDNDL